MRTTPAQVEVCTTSFSLAAFILFDHCPGGPKKGNKKAKKDKKKKQQQTKQKAHSKNKTINVKKQNKSKLCLN